MDFTILLQDLRLAVRRLSAGEITAEFTKWGIP
ncbi:hypothetical protein SAMN00790413_04802 [Deinococcus hopiensis KR-140]|uniref:Uncharacterized protein n=1 Tax=Deinococcus hopiensis KR-140 TaxID=695939 RepID=A0A1W1ULT9_9DEIO|nr:hypothetical protein SAMN00790413_04802 [Deinococcus hopiensis KR-140]